MFLSKFKWLWKWFKAGNPTGPKLYDPNEVVGGGLLSKIARLFGKK